MAIEVKPVEHLHAVTDGKEKTEVKREDRDTSVFISAPVCNGRLTVCWADRSH